MLQNQPSDREREILSMICEGMTAREIANELYISAGTVETHKRNLLLKLDVRNSVQLAVKAVRMGFV